MSSSISALGKVSFVYIFGFLNLALFVLKAIKDRSFFHRSTEREKLLLATYQDEFWNLAKDYYGLFHCFYTLKRSKLTLHYLSNDPHPTPSTVSKPIIFLIHGFPDSCFVWRQHLQRFQKTGFLERATIIALDLPGYGGSDSFAKYDATEVLEALTEFIAEMREGYQAKSQINGPEDTHSLNPGDVYIVGHDWGCALAYRLAAEAPYLADRFILTNGPHPQLAKSNIERILSSTKKMLVTCYNNPLNSRLCLAKVFSTARPLLRQLVLSGYIFAFQLPNFLVSYLFTSGNRFFLRSCHNLSIESEHKKPEDQAQCMASTLGPSIFQCKFASTEDTPGRPGLATDRAQRYPGSVLYRAQRGNAIDTTAYYRDGAALGKWDKSIETLATLHNLETSMTSLSSDSSSPHHNGKSSDKPRRSSSATLFSESLPGALKAPVTVLWAADDVALTAEVCLNGITDYLVKGSEVVKVMGVGHWGIPYHKIGMLTLGKVLEELTKEDYDGSVPGERVKEEVKKMCIERMGQDVKLFVKKK